MSGGFQRYTYFRWRRASDAAAGCTAQMNFCVSGENRYTWRRQRVPRTYLWKPATSHPCGPAAMLAP